MVRQSDTRIKVGETSEVMTGFVGALALEQWHTEADFWRDLYGNCG
ncbi:hypothetical protein ACFL1X_11475 [Candidatus Hydrogenedentota bacterium]